MRTLVWLPLFLYGCAPTLDFETDATAVTATAREDGTVEVSICAGPRELFSCNDAEAFRVAVGDSVLEGDELNQPLLGGQRAYFADAGAGARVVVTRLRDGAEMSATLPARFAIVGPPAGSTVSRAGGLTVRWDVAGDVSWSWGSTCGDGAFEARADDVDEGDRHVTLRGSALPAVPAGGECELTMNVGLRKAGEVSGRYADGSGIAAVRERSLTVRLVP
jgi:hypothetical protein